MKINWPNVFALVLAVLSGVMLLNHRSAVGAVLSTVAAIGPGHSSEEKTLGLLTLGICCVCLVAIIRLLAHRK